MDNLNRLIEIFSHFPGIGPRQARRFAYYLLGKPQSFIKEFAKLVEEVKKATTQCGQCQRLFIGNSIDSRLRLPVGRHGGNDNSICSVCSDPARDHSTLMIVARDSDFESIEKSGAYRGLYFILGGTVPVLDKEPEKRIRLRQLLEKVSSTGSDLVASNTSVDDKPIMSNNISFNEIILSLNTTPDGEHTADIVHAALNNLSSNRSAKSSTSSSPKITILGRGLSTGAELEYVDSETIINALKNRA